MCMCLSNFGYPVPFFYLPTFAKQKILNLTELVSTQHDDTLVCWEVHNLRQLSVLSVTTLNISAGIGRCFAGFFADRIGPTNAMFIVVLVSGLVQLLVWNFVSDYPGIVSTLERDVAHLNLTLYRWLCRHCTASSGSASGHWQRPSVRPFLSFKRTYRRNDNPSQQPLRSMAQRTSLGYPGFYSFLRLLVREPSRGIRPSSLNVTGEILGPPISGAIYGATNSWHCVIAFSGTIQVAAAIVLLYGVLASLRFARLRLTNAGSTTNSARFKREPSVFKVY